MSENIEPRELPHQLLMRRYDIKVNDLNPHARQLKKDLDKTLQLVINKSKGGAIKLTPLTQQKIEAYDRYICDGVFEILEDEDNIDNKLVEEIKESAEDKREEIVEKMEEMHEQAKEEVIEEKTGIEKELEKKSNENNPVEMQKETTENSEEKPVEPQEEKSSVKIGFWNWK